EGDGKPEIFMLSADERQVGVTKLDEKQRLPFPTLIPVNGKPLVLAVGKLQPNEKPTLAVIVEQEGTADEGSKRVRFTPTPDGTRELLLTQTNFLRAVVLKSDSSLQNSTNRGGWTFAVKEQINGTASNSRLIAAAAVPNGTNASPSLFLLDAERKALTLCERDKAGVFQVVRNLPLPVSEFTGLQPIALGGPNMNAVGFLGLNAVAYMPLEGKVWE